MSRMTDTNIFVDMAANTDKLVSTDKRVAPDNLKTEVELDDEPSRYKIKPAGNDDNEHDRDREREHHKHDDDDDDEDLTEEQKKLRKMDMIRKLGELAQKGEKISENYNLNSSYKVMKAEYDIRTSIRSKTATLNWMSGFLKMIVKGVELFNDNYNPFDMKFNGTWSADIEKKSSSLDDVLGEIYEKYSSPDKAMAPELKLFLILTSSAFTIQFYKTLTDKVAGASKVIDNDPEAIQKMREKAEQDRLLEEEQQRKANDEALKKINDIKLLEQTKTVVDKAKEINNNEEAYKTFTNNMMLSESAQSRKSFELPSAVKSGTPVDRTTGFSEVRRYADKNVIMDGTQEMYIQQLNQQRKDQFIAKQKELEKLNNLLDDANKIKTKKPKKQDDNSSTISSISVNKDVAKIIANKKKKDNESTATSTSSKSKKSDHKSKISINGRSGVINL
jgi:hypothetical protein